MTNPAVALVVDAVATYRLTRLVQRDTFPPVKAAREAVLKSNAPDWVAELLMCGWCASFWIGLGVVAARRIAPKVYEPVAMALVGSAVAGLLTEREELTHAELERVG